MVTQNLIKESYARRFTVYRYTYLYHWSDIVNVQIITTDISSIDPFTMSFLFIELPKTW